MSDFHFCVILCSVLTKGTISPKLLVFGSSKTAQEAAASTGLAKNYGRYDQWEKLVVNTAKGASSNGEKNTQHCSEKAAVS